MIFFGGHAAMVLLWYLDTTMFFLKCIVYRVNTMLYLVRVNCRKIGSWSAICCMNIVLRLCNIVGILHNVIFLKVVVI